MKMIQLKKFRKFTPALVVIFLVFGSAIFCTSKNLYARSFPKVGDFVDTPWGILKVHWVSSVAWNCNYYLNPMPSPNPSPGSFYWGYGTLFYYLRYTIDGKNTGDYPHCDQVGGYARGTWAVYFKSTVYPDATPTWPPLDDPCAGTGSVVNSKCNEENNEGPPECEENE